MDSILHSLRAIFVPIRREGYPFIVGFFLAALIVGWAWRPLFWVGLVLTVWCIYFFRDPPRVPPVGAALVISPADGRIASVGKRWFRLTDTYGVEVEPGNDDGLVLAVAVVVDQISHPRG